MKKFHPRLIAVDLDGTLLNSARQITQETRAAISFARRQGVKVLPCSGRHFSGTRSVARQAGMGDAVICGNGALVTTWQGEDHLGKHACSRTMPGVIAVLFLLSSGKQSVCR